MRIESFPEAALFAAQLADTARPIALRYFRAPLAVSRKADGSPVTLADREIERELRRLISERFPDHGIIGEETGGARGRRYTWILDPIDGTKSFICGNPLFGFLLGLLDDERPVLGLIDMPATSERWLSDGEKTLFNDSEAHVSGCGSLAEARLCLGSLDPASPAQKGLDSVRKEAWLTRLGEDCYSYGLLASGHCDLVIESGLEPWDYVPLIAVVTGAGGLIADWDGQPLGLHSDGNVIAAATPDLLREALSVLSQNG